MIHHLTSVKRAKAISLALFFIGIAVLLFTNYWWPWIMLVIGISLGLRQYLLGRFYDMCITLFVFCGIFFTVHFAVSWEIILPILFTLAGIFIFFREYIEANTPTEEEVDEDVNHEIEEEPKK